MKVEAVLVPLLFRVDPPGDLVLLLWIFVELLEGLPEEGEDDVDDLVGHCLLFCTNKGVGVQFEPTFQDLIHGVQVMVHVGDGHHVVGEGRGYGYDCVGRAILEDFLQTIGGQMQDEIGQYPFRFVLGLDGGRGTWMSEENRAIWHTISRVSSESIFCIGS